MKSGINTEIFNPCVMGMRRLAMWWQWARWRGMRGSLHQWRLMTKPTKAHPSCVPIVFPSGPKHLRTMAPLSAQILQLCKLYISHSRSPGQVRITLKYPSSPINSFSFIINLFCYIRYRIGTSLHYEEVKLTLDTAEVLRPTFLFGEPITLQFWMNKWY